MIIVGILFTISVPGTALATSPLMFSFFRYTALITLFGAVFINEFVPWTIFASFAVLMALQQLFTALIMPETKGVAPEDIETKLVSS